MLVLSSFSLIAILLTYLETTGQCRKGMLWGFVIMTLVAALRYEYGNDYVPYMKWIENADQYTSYSISHFLDFSDGFKEQGWSILLLLCQPLGFIGFFALLSTFNSVAYYRLIDRFVEGKWRVFAMFIYLFNTGNYVMSLSMIRQSFAMALILFAIPFILDKKKWPILLVLLAPLMHTSALIAVPFVLLLYIPFNNRKLLFAGLVVAFGIFIYGQNLLLSIMDEMMASTEAFDKYESRYGEGKGTGASNIMGLVSIGVPIIVSLYALLKNKLFNESQIKIITFGILGCAFVLSSSINMMMARIAMYFTIANVAVFPMCYKVLPIKLLQKALVALFVVITLREYYAFFMSATWHASFYEYRSIFSLIF